VIYLEKIDSTVVKETKYITVWVVLFSVLMQAVFLVLSRWNYTVLLGNLLGGSAAILNFLFMGITVQKAVLCDEKKAKTVMHLSQTYRTLFMLAVIVIGVVVHCFDMWAVIIPVFFPRIAIAFRPAFKNENK